MTVCDALYERALPFDETLDVRIGSVRTDDVREFCGKVETHPHELLLAMEGVPR